MANRTAKTVPLYVRIPIDIHDRLHVQADARHMSLSLLVTVLLAEGLDRLGDGPVVIPNRDANPNG